MNIQKEDKRNRHGRRADVAWERGRDMRERKRKAISHALQEHNKKERGVKLNIAKVTARREARDAMRKDFGKITGVNYKRIVLMGPKTNLMEQYSIKK